METDQQRAARRKKIFRPGTATWDGGTHRVHLLNISLTGVLGHASPAPPEAARVAVEIDGWRCQGRVVWSAGTRFGLCFTYPLTNRRLDELLARWEVPALG